MLHSKACMRAAVLVILLTASSASAQRILDYAKNDARMNAAMEKSLATLPAFDAALEHKLLGILNVRVPYGEGGNEYLWLTNVRRNADGSYDGTITDVVAHAPYLHQGSPYPARRDQVADWMFRAETGGDHGGWTGRLMQTDSPALGAPRKCRFVD